LFAARRNLKLIICKRFGTATAAPTYQPG